MQNQRYVGGYKQVVFSLFPKSILLNVGEEGTDPDETTRVQDPW